MIDERIGRVAPPCRRPRHHDVVALVEQGAVALVERRHVEPVGEAGVERRTRRGEDRRGRPPTGRRRRRRSPVSRSSSSASTQPRSATTRSTRPVGPCLRRRPHRRDVEHLAAADGLVATRLAQHEAVAGHQRQGGRRGAAAPGRRPPGPMASGPSTRTRTGLLARPDVGEVGAAAGHRVVEAGEHVQRGVDHRRGVPAVGHDDGVAPPQLRVIDAAEVEGDPVPGPDRVDRSAQRLDRPDACRRSRAGSTPTRSPVAIAPSVSVPVTTVPLPLAANTRSIHSRARPRSGRPAWCGRAPPARPQLGQARPAARATGTIGAPSRNVPADALGDLQRGELDELVVDQVDLRQRDDAVAHAEQLEDAQVLLALRLPPLGGGDDEQAGVDAADAGQHVAQEPDVAGHVDEADRLAVDARCGRSRGRSSGPRRFSSAKRSGSVPVRASTSDDLPWSTWPAVAITRTGAGPPRARRRRPARRRAGRARSRRRGPGR